MPTAPEAAPALVRGGVGAVARPPAVVRSEAWSAGGEAAPGADAPLDRHARVMRCVALIEGQGGDLRLLATRSFAPSGAC